MSFLLFVGSHNTLATEEVLSQFPDAVKLSNYVFELFGKREELLAQVSRLGSAVKLAEKLAISDHSPLSIISSINSKNFSITSHDKDINSYALSHEIKSLRPELRYLKPEDELGISPLIIDKQHVAEFFIQKPGVYYTTIWIHDYKAWIRKDRFMPFASGRVGMLPPKIARTMINLVPNIPDGLLVDPFCGFGRVLVEGAELGYRVFGVDISVDQVKSSQENLKHAGIEGTIVQGDATHLSAHIKDIDLIVTEPYLGSPKVRPDQFSDVAKGLGKLYLGCLKDWQKLLKPGGYVVMIFPFFVDGKKEIRTSRIIDDPHLIGYNQTKRGLDYYRENANVRREIVILQKN